MALLKPEASGDGSSVSPLDGDRVAYVKKGKELGFISLNVNPSPEYAYYENYSIKSRDFEAKLTDFNNEVKAYNADVQDFNRWVEGTTFTAGSSEARRAGEWKQQLQMSLYLLKSEEAGLDREKAELGPIWESMGTVSNIDIRW